MLYIKLFIEREKNIGQSAPECPFKGTKLHFCVLMLQRNCLLILLIYFLLIYFVIHLLAYLFFEFSKVFINLYFS